MKYKMVQKKRVSYYDKLLHKEEEKKNKPSLALVACGLHSQHISPFTPLYHPSYGLLAHENQSPM